MAKNPAPKVTVYIPCHNYGRYLKRAVDSVFAQTLKDWELIIIDDGSTDDTARVLAGYRHDPRIRIISQKKKGLAVSNNIALRLAGGRYVMRLDADDWLDENALLVLSHVLDTKPEIGLVYPDYTLVDDDGEILEIVRRKKIGAEARLLDLPAHGACTMIRRECLLELGGYTEAFACQDGYDLWLRFLKSFKPYNVNVPLFYYRQHPGSLTTDQRKILDTRAAIKRRFVREHRNGHIPKVLAIIPVARRAKGLPDSAFSELGGRPLLSYTLEAAAEALGAGALERAVVCSEDPAALEFTKRWPRLGRLARPDSLSSSSILDTVRLVLKELKKNQGYAPDAVMLLYVSAPLRRSVHISMAVDTMEIFGVDSVVSVTEELAHCYHHGADGLTPLRKARDLQIEKRSIYKENAAILLAKTPAPGEKDFIRGKIGHILMLPEESVRIRTHFEFWQADKILSEWRPRFAPPAPARVKGAARA